MLTLVDRTSILPYIALPNAAIKIATISKMKFQVLFVCYLLDVCLPSAKTQFGNFNFESTHLNPGNYPTQFNKYERIVTSKAEVKYGVEPDYRYVETTTIGKLLSAPGCPKSSLGIPWLYYKLRQGVRCYLAGSEGPCGRGQVFTPVPGSRYGYCNCLCPLIGAKTGLTQYYDERLQFCTGAREQEIDIISMYEFVFIPRKKHCYQLYSQAFCDRGYWLVKTGENGLNCEQRLCPHDYHPYYNRKKLECKIPPAVGNTSSSLSKSPCRNVMKDYIDHFGTCVVKVKYDFDD